MKIGKKSRDFGALDVSDSCSLKDLKSKFQKLHNVSYHRQSYKLRNGDDLKVTGVYFKSNFLVL